MTKLYTYEADFEQYVEDIQERKPLLIDEDMFYYWLEVLPPVYMFQMKTVQIDGVGHEKFCSFGFAEGFDCVIDFYAKYDDVPWVLGNLNFGKLNYWALMSDRSMSIAGGEIND